MDKKIEEMIALGAAYVLNCLPCMEYHQKVAIEAGVTQEEMQAVIRLAETVKAGASSKTKQYAGSKFGFVQPDRCCAPGSECCP
jgi:AhpD family alkylhydroperoxidase